MKPQAVVSIADDHVKLVHINKPEGQSIMEDRALAIPLPLAPGVGVGQALQPIGQPFVRAL